MSIRPERGNNLVRPTTTFQLLVVRDVVQSEPSEIPPFVAGAVEIPMEAGAFKLLESATQRTLHAHAFTRSSNQASLVLTDLLSRYLSLLTSTCAKYAQHSGRTTMNMRDTAAALEELGVSLLDLNEYCATEGKELNRYALYSARRVEDLLDFKCMFTSER